MPTPTENETAAEPPLVPKWGLIGGLAVLVVTAVAAPFYGQVLGGMMWAGEVLKSLCG